MITMPEFSLWQRIIILAIPLLFAITLHEVAHGWVAYQRGDMTAKMMGRLTLNPIKHIDLFGTIFVPALLFYFGGFIFGWAKPVPVNWRHLKRPKQDMALVAAAGPAANFMMACLWAFFAKIFLIIGSPITSESPLIGLLTMCRTGILINLVLLVLNLLPIPPLDGSRVLASFASLRVANFLRTIEPFGFIILVILIMTSVLGKIMIPIISALYSFIASVFQLI